MKTKLPVTKNERLDATIIDLTYQGMGVAKIEDYPLFISGALPGEEVKIHVMKVGKKFGYAKVIKWYKKSPERVEVTGQEYTQTGIAPLQHLSYAGQLAFKKKQVVNLLQKSHMEHIEVADVLGMDKPYNYRNKAQVPAREYEGELTTGFFRRNSHTFIPLEDSLIQAEKINEIIQKVTAVLRKYHVAPYDEQAHTGVIRNIMVRWGFYSKEAMVVLVTRTKRIPQKAEIVAEIKEACPEVVSIVQNINAAQTNVIMGERNIILAGKEAIKDTLNGLTFEISANSFYQVNPLQTEKLYQKVVEYAGLTGKETVIDAYCGIGTISLNLAQAAKKVYGVEVVPEAIEDAKKNAKLNKLDNVVFEVGKAETKMAEWQSQGMKPDVIVVDPPRKGLDEQFINSAVETAPNKIVYVSCNPATLVRDIQRFEELGYQVTQPILPVDQFPQTPHVECVALLTKK
ncbi:23S rRNA (uracil(1939)-C(5))-methyltransferase RlmD [Ligilactobacillus ceti]|uniref:tRNA (Uracil-5-)-methyltransferase n=1 Tax=Ligilactobacillus ceti DSM 22408 TaxID=1122146 RepID=A0A0R2KG67_9LACO|nr:23S rRNA (uracil(1939)-C(5))-methyltransferase RlmD [Ligilactobacillus ceti]KRN88350.1 tRNA (Uracil-5-) -methyltransferase [Ligilactobacillus ceti DSM 22408]